jgi:hypothetical protein
LIISNKKLLSIILTTVILSSLVGFGLKTEFNDHVHVDPKAKANVYVFAETSSGTEVLCPGNQIQDIGDAFVGSLVGLAGSGNTTARNATQWISLSNNALPAQSATQLPSEIAANGFTRALGTVSALYINGDGDYGFNVTKTFTATGTQQLQLAGLQWSGVASSDSNLFAAAAFTQTTFNAGDNLTISWSITFTH